MIHKNKPTLVFIHYFGGDAGSWEWVDRKLNDKYNCVYLTLPGFGSTQPLENLSIRDFSEWIAQEIRALEIENYILVGHSMGCKLALFSAFTLHDLLPSKLILIAPSQPTADVMDEFDKTLIENHPNLEEAKISVEKSTRKALRDTKFNYAVQSQLQVDHSTWKWWFESGRSEDITWAIKNLNVPTFVIHSSHDPVISSETLTKETLPYLNKVKLITFGRAGHFIPLESPRKLARLLKKIIKDY